VNIALLADRLFGDFVLEVDLIQTGKEYGHRDMCLFFGCQSPTNFYYAHIATAADDHAHNVSSSTARRGPRSRRRRPGRQLGPGVWHKGPPGTPAGRRQESGFISTISPNPSWWPRTKRWAPATSASGHLNDTGMVDNLRVWAPTVEKKTTEFFTRQGG